MNVRQDRNLQARPLLHLLGLAMLISFVFLFVLHRQWTTGEHAFLGLSGYLPVSDALGYYRCAVGAVGFGNVSAVGIPAEWCARRGVYPVMLGSLLGVLGWKAAYALIAQAVLLALCSAAAIAAVLSAYGWIAALVTTAGVLSFIESWAVGNFMTEVAGVCFGLIALVFFIRGMEMQRRSSVLLGLAALSLGLSARAGAIFALPLAIAALLAGLGAQRIKTEGVRVLAGAAVAVCTGLLAQAATSRVLGADLANTGGNFSTTLYGLSTGTRDWAQAYRDFEQVFRTESEREAFDIVKAKAIENVLESPAILLAALSEALRSFVNSLFRFSDRLSQFADALTWLFWLGFIRCLVQWRNPLNLLLFSIALGELLSAPFIIDSGGQRVLAATFWIRPLLAGLGLAWIASWIVQVKSTRTSSLTSVQDPTVSYFANALLVLLVALALIPMTPLGTPIRVTTVISEETCSNGSSPVVAAPGNESMVVSISHTPKLPVGPQLVLPMGTFERPNPKNYWWQEGWGAIPSGSSLIYAFDRRSPGGRFNVFLWHGELPLRGSESMVFCEGESLPGRRVGDIALKRASPLRPRQ